MHQNRRRPRLAAIASLAALLAATSVAPAASGSARSPAPRPGTWCGGTLWRLMTLSDPGRSAVKLRPAATSIATIAALHPPRRIGAARTTPFQRQAWQLTAVVDRYRIASNGEIVLILYSIASAQYMNAYMPNPHCLSWRTRDRGAIARARRALTSRCPPPTPAWQLLGITAEVTGVGYWNPVRTTRGALRNGAELRPITDFRIIAGCGVP